MFGLKAGYVFAVLIVGMAFGAGEPNSVGEILKLNKLEWVIGEWEAITDTNEAAVAKFELTLDDYVLSLKASVGRYEYEGMAYYITSKNMIVNKGADNEGRTFGGSWLIDGDKLLLKIEQTSRDGSVYYFERSLSKIEENTMKSVTYSVIEGKRYGEPINVLEFKRKKQEPDKARQNQQ